MELSIALPAYNEAAVIRGVVVDLYETLRKEKISFEIVVVDNGSTDNSREVLEKLTEIMPELKVVSIFPNRGLGNGILHGLKEARGEVLGWMPGDGQLNAEDLLKVYRVLSRGGHEMCKGNRAKRNDTFPRLVQSKVFNTLFYLFFGINSKDVNGAPKLFTRALYDRLGLASRDWFIDAELLIKAHRAGVPLSEVPIAGQFRTGGASKVRFGTALEFLKNMIKYKFNA